MSGMEAESCGIGVTLAELRRRNIDTQRVGNEVVGAHPTGMGNESKRGGSHRAWTMLLVSTSNVNSPLRREGRGR
jgi:hypothetical protein